jgi:hypothetical protein
MRNILIHYGACPFFDILEKNSKIRAGHEHEEYGNFK